MDDNYRASLRGGMGRDVSTITRKGGGGEKKGEGEEASL